MNWLNIIFYIYSKIFKDEVKGTTLFINEKYINVTQVAMGTIALLVDLHPNKFAYTQSNYLSEWLHVRHSMFEIRVYLLFFF